MKKIQLKKIIFLTLFLSAFNTLAVEKLGEYRGAMHTEYPSWFKQGFLDFNEDVKDAAKVGKRLMIIFTQPGCPYCNALVERNLSQKKIEQKVRKNFDSIAINMWGDREVTFTDGKIYTEKTISEKLKVQFTPTVLFFNEQGKTILRLNGYIPPRRFNVALDYVIKHQETKVSYRAYVKANLPAGKSGGLNKEDFFMKAPVNLAVKGAGRDKPFAVFFEQKHCPSCDTLHKKVLTDSYTRNIIKQFDVAQLDMWSNKKLTIPDGSRTTAKLWAKSLDVKYAPTVIIFNAKGKEIIRSEAFFKVFHTQGMFAYVLEGGYKKQPSFQRYLAARAEHFREQGKTIDIWNYKSEHDSGKKK
ncbi:thioredoxin SoxW [hydrothermal vent metagenome]|uniref:Thioredoxin SoxW n=1 Tax=hydrothermal vent metagenome TaxID=652676 RepID=A0A3B1A4V3_9ZZZZ